MSSGWILQWVQDVIFMTVVPSLRLELARALILNSDFFDFIVRASISLWNCLCWRFKYDLLHCIHTDSWCSRLCDLFRLCKCGQEYDDIASPDGKTALLKGPCNRRTWMDLCRLIPVLIIQIPWGFMFLFFILHRYSICKKSAAVKAMCVCFSTLIFGCFLTSW